MLSIVLYIFHGFNKNTSLIVGIGKWFNFGKIQKSLGCFSPQVFPPNMKCDQTFGFHDFVLDFYNINPFLNIIQFKSI